MSPNVPADDTERVPLSGRLTLIFAIAYPALWLGAMTCTAVALLFAGGVDAPLGAVFFALLLLAGVVGWRWATPLRGVVATRTGLLVTGLGGTRFVPYAAMASARENRLQNYRPITVTLREPAGSRFVFIPPYRPFIGLNGAHPVAVELARRLAHDLRCNECGSPFIEGTAAMADLCAECSHLLYGYPACQHQFDPTGACSRCGWNQSRSEYTSKLAGSGPARPAGA